jgi:purine nucleosidase
MLRAFIMMGGRYLAGGGQEWNTSCDPLASRIVFEADVPELAAFGLDVTLQCRMPAAECRARLRGGPLDMVMDMAEIWFRRQDRIVFHDPLAAVCAFEPEICNYRTGRIAMAGDGAGTTFEEAPGGHHRVAAEVNADRFFERYFQTTAVFAP